MNTLSNKKSIVKRVYITIVFFLSLSGFGQMPIFKRYYIADISGFGWLAKYYITLHMHYLFAVLFLGLCAFLLFEYFLINRKKIRLVFSGYLRTAIILGLLLTGILLVIKNFTYSGFSPVLIVSLYLTHLFLVMSLLATSFLCIIFKKGWIINIQEE